MLIWFDNVSGHGVDYISESIAIVDDQTMGPLLGLGTWQQNFLQKLTLPKAKAFIFKFANDS